MASTRTLLRESRDATDERIMASEEEFYSSYGWCLNPAISIPRADHEDPRGDRSLPVSPAVLAARGIPHQSLPLRLRARLHDGRLSGGRPARPLRNPRRWPRLRIPLSVLGALLDIERRVRNLCLHGRIWRWRRRWNRASTRSAKSWSASRARRKERIGDWGREARLLLDARLPQGFCSAACGCPRIPWRGSDALDVLSLARRFDATNTAREGPLLVLGLRTAGAYFAPLVHAQLSALGRPSASWMTIRPRGDSRSGRSGGWHGRGASRRRFWSWTTIPTPDGRSCDPGIAGAGGDSTPAHHPTRAAPSSRANWTLPRSGTAEQVSALIREPRDLYKSRCSPTDRRARWWSSTTARWDGGPRAFAAVGPSIGSTHAWRSTAGSSTRFTSGANASSRSS